MDMFANTINGKRYQIQHIAEPKCQKEGPSTNCSAILATQSSSFLRIHCFAVSTTIAFTLSRR